MFASTKLVLFLVLGSLFSALFLVDGRGRGRFMSPDRMEQRMLESMAEHLGGDMDRATRELGSTHEEYDTVCEEFAGISEYPTFSDFTSTTDEMYDCLCNCDGFDLGFFWSSSGNDWETMVCAYESLSEAVTACFGSDALENCEDACSTSGVNYWTFYECEWSYYHFTYYNFSSLTFCSDNYTSSSSWLEGPSSKDTTDSSACVYYDTDSEDSSDDDSNSFVFDWSCDWYSGAAPSAGHNLIATVIFANGLLVATFLAAALL